MIAAGRPTSARGAMTTAAARLMTVSVGEPIRCADSGGHLFYRQPDTEQHKSADQQREHQARIRRWPEQDHQRQCCDRAKNRDGFIPRHRKDPPDDTDRRKRLTNCSERGSVLSENKYQTRPMRLM